jgi:hypothetical protein
MQKRIHANKSPIGVWGAPSKVPPELKLRLIEKSTWLDARGSGNSFDPFLKDFKAIDLELKVREKNKKKWVVLLLRFCANFALCISIVHKPLDKASTTEYIDQIIAQSVVPVVPRGDPDQVKAK